MKATFDSNGILVSQYPFPLASVYPHGRVECSAIRDVDPFAGRMETRTRRGETLFISAEQSDAFHDWIMKSQLPIVRRIDAWHLILEPFLDPDFTSDAQEQTLVALSNMSVTQTDAIHIRKTVRSTMLSESGFLWDWGQLGLIDVLTATRLGLGWLSLSHRLFPKRYSEFYWSAMELADRGRIEIDGKASEQ